MKYDIERLEQNHGITWDELVTMEPALADLLERAENTFGDLEKRWASFKRPIAELVGMHRRAGEPRLHTMAAYEVAYYTLWNIVSGD